MGTKPQQEVQLANSADSRPGVVLRQTLRCSGLQLVDAPSEHFASINADLIHICVDRGPSAFDQAIRLATTQPPFGSGVINADAVTAFNFRYLSLSFTEFEDGS